MDREIHIIGGGTFFHIRPHLALAAPAYGATPRKLGKLCKAHSPHFPLSIHLTRMAGGRKDPLINRIIETNQDISDLIDKIITDGRPQVVFMCAALCDYDAVDLESFDKDGDTTIGKNVNIGAGVKVANYDGKNKHKTAIEDKAFIGCNSVLVAPVTIGENAVVAAGSVITKDVPKNALAIARERQTNKAGYRKP